MVKPRVVIDTNLFVSAIIVRGSLPDQILRLWQTGHYILVTSSELIFEIETVLQRNDIKKHYGLSTEIITQVLTLLRLGSESVSPISEENLPIHSRDSNDDKLLALAFGGGSDYLITGDKDLLVLNGNPLLGRLKIVTAREFLVREELRKSQGGLSLTSVGKKLDLEKVIKKAEKKEAERLINGG